MVEIDVSEKERFSGRMSREHRDAAVEAVHRGCPKSERIWVEA